MSLSVGGIRTRRLSARDGGARSASLSVSDLAGRHLSGEPWFATVSGVATTNLEMLDWFARETAVEILTTKSIELEPNPGNREPVVTEPRPGCFGNAVGLRNPGAAVALAELRQLRERWTLRSAGTDRWTPPLLGVSLSGNSADQFAQLVHLFSPAADFLELNLSCPHAAAGYGAAIGSDPAAVGEVTSAAIAAANESARHATVRCPVFVKLTPNVNDIRWIARAAVVAGADGIVAINTVGPVKYVEPHSGSPVLMSRAGSQTDGEDSDSEAVITGRGGMSGRWVLPYAVRAVAAIRAAAGETIPVIGMGGVSSAQDAARLVRAGADCVGIGSALAGHHQREWATWLAAVADETRELLSSDRSGSPAAGVTAPPADDLATAPPAAAPEDPVILGDTAMAFTPMRIAANVPIGPDIFEVTLDGRCDVRAGQSVFLWIPGVGEKPFAPAVTDPLRFIVKIKGEFTTALSRCDEGEAVYLRGPYGDAHGRDAWPVAGPRRVIMVVAGTGLAAVAPLVGELGGSNDGAAGPTIELLVGLRDRATAVPLADVEALHNLLRVVYDDGQLGRVLDYFSESLPESDADRTVVYTVGPEPFMARAISIARDAGVPADAIFASVERTMMCGVGLCGACQCGGNLTCHHGTFVTARQLEEERARSEGAGEGGAPSGAAVDFRADGDEGSRHG